MHCLLHCFSILSLLCVEVSDGVLQMAAISVCAPCKKKIIFFPIRFYKLLISNTDSDRNEKTGILFFFTM